MKQNPGSRKSFTGRFLKKNRFLAFSKMVVDFLISDFFNCQMFANCFSHLFYWFLSHFYWILKTRESMICIGLWLPSAFLLNLIIWYIPFVFAVYIFHWNINHHLNKMIHLILQIQCSNVWCLSSDYWLGRVNAPKAK